MSTYFDNLPKLLDLTKMPIMDGISFFQTLVDGKVLMLYMTGQFQVQALVYTAVMMVMTMCFFSAAYVINKTVEAALKLTTTPLGFAFQYRERNSEGPRFWADMMGVWELFAIGTFGMYSLTMILVTLLGGGSIWSMVEEREKGAAEGGKLGEAFDFIQAVKFFTLALMVGFTSIIGSYSFGDVADQLITWFDYQSHAGTQARATNKKGEVIADTDTGNMYDILGQFFILMMSHMLFTVIGFGGHVFGFIHMAYTDLEECDMDLLDAGKKEDILALFGKFTTLESCYENIIPLMKLADVNNDGNIGRCEDANLMRVLAPENTVEYAMKYSHNQPLSTGYNRCEELFNPLF